MSDSYVQLALPAPPKPAYFSPKNDLFRTVRQDFGLGVLKWEQATGYVARLFNTQFEPDFAVPEAIPAAAAWSSDPVALQEVVIDEDGYCKAHGVRFGPLYLQGSYPIYGCCIYIPPNRMIWAATDYIGNFPVLNQDVYVTWAGNYGGPFRL